jgi:hypothetical protein
MTGNADRIIFTLCKHCGRAISLNPARFWAGKPDWNGMRYWCHFHITDDDHLPEPKTPFVDHLINIGPSAWSLAAERS